MNGINPEDLVMHEARKRMYHEMRQFSLGDYTYRETTIIEAAARVLAEYHKTALALRNVNETPMEYNRFRHIP